MYEVKTYDPVKRRAGFFDRLLARLPAPFKASNSGPFIGPGDIRYDSFMGIGMATGHLANTPQGRIEIANSAIWVHACIQARANAVKNVPMRLYKTAEGGVDHPVEGHPIMDVLTNINPYSDSETSFRTNIEQSLSIHGRYQILKRRNRAKVVKELYGLPTQYCQPIADPQTFIGKFRYGVGNDKRDFLPQDIIYFRYPPYDGGVDGIGPLVVAMETTRADVNIARAQNSISENGAKPSMMVTVKNKMEDADYERLNEQLIRNYAGVANQGKILLMDNAEDSKVAPYQLSPRELQWVQEHTAHVNDICSAFQVPPVVAGDYSASSVLANAGAAHRFFWELWVLPELELWEDIFNWQLLWTEDWGHGVGWEAEQGLYLKHDVTNVAALREDENSRSLRGIQMFTSGATINQALKFRGLPPLEDERGNTILVPSNVVTLDSIIAMSQQVVGNLPPDEPQDVDVSDKTVQEATTLESDWEHSRYKPKGPMSSQNLREKPQQTEPSFNTAKPFKNPRTAAATRSAPEPELSRAALDDLRRWKTVAKKSAERAGKFQTDYLPSDVEANLKATLEDGGVGALIGAINNLTSNNNHETIETKAAFDIESQVTALQNSLVALVRRYFRDNDSEEFKQAFERALSDAYMTVLFAVIPGATSDDEEMVQTLLTIQYGYLSGFISDLRTGDVTQARAENRARLYALSLIALLMRLDLKKNPTGNFMWKMDPMAEHCNDCIELDGTIHTGSWWQEHQIPRDGQTECMMNCRCSLVPVE